MQTGYQQCLQTLLVISLQCFVPNCCFSERLKEENIQHTKVVDMMTKERTLFQKRLEEVNSELTEVLEFIKE